ncbi:MAG: hypothetical protein PHV51_10570 [Methanosarcinaceae archaeon]|nr:hypothetical protein [Methanosarcinaceae archaeon]MDD4498566.1 hypothetical protein [Methanosarcinaceae archaeon]
MSRFNLNGAGREEQEIKEDLCGRIELFDQNVRSFEMRLRAVERRLSLEPLSCSGPGFSGSSEPFRGALGQETGASSPLLSPEGPSVSPAGVLDAGAGTLHPDFTSLEGAEASPLLSLSPSGSPAVSSSVFPGGRAGDGGGLSFSQASAEKLKEMDALLEGFSESLQVLEGALAELSDFVHTRQAPEIQRLDSELEERKTVGKATAAKLEKRLEDVENQSRLTFGSIKVPVEISGITGALALFLTGSLVWLGRWDVIRSPYFPTGLAVLMALAVFFKFYMINRKKENTGPEAA